jgi:hypothetical protein
MTWGIQPSIAVIEMAPQNNFPAEGGELVFWYGGTVIRIPDCRIDKASVRVDERGQIVSLSIFDWRWRWAFPTISGYYNYTDYETGPVNQINPSGAIDIARVRSARELADLCLKAMGEKNYDISALPSNVFPAVDWACENAATALQQIASECGCAVVPRLNRTVLIGKEGTGAEIPTAPLLDGGVTIDPPQVPDSIELVCGPTLYQAVLPLVAVGLDTDGRIKLVNNLSYKPAAGWGRIDPVAFGELPGGNVANPQVTNRSSPRDLAQRTVWRWYSIYKPANGLSVPGFGPIQDINQIIPLNAFRLDKTIKDGKEEREEAMAIGSWAKRDATTGNESRTQYTRPFDIDTKRGIVIFNEPVFKYAGPPKGKVIVSADMEIWTSFSIRVPPTFEHSRYTKKVDIPGAKWNTGPKKIVKDDIVHEKKAVYNNAGTITGISTNIQQIDPQLNFYLDAELKTYQVSDPSQATLIGIIPVSLDGAIRQVAWQVTDRGSITTVSRNCEFSSIVPPYELRRRWDQIRRVVDANERAPAR